MKGVLDLIETEDQGILVNVQILACRVHIVVMFLQSFNGLNDTLGHLVIYISHNAVVDPVELDQGGDVLDISAYIIIEAIDFDMTGIVVIGCRQVDVVIELILQPEAMMISASIIGKTFLITADQDSYGDIRWDLIEYGFQIRHNRSPVSFTVRCLQILEDEDLAGGHLDHNILRVRASASFHQMRSIVVAF